MMTSESETKPKKKRIPNHKKIKDVDSMVILMAKQGHGSPIIAKATGLTKSVVDNRLRKLKNLFEELDNVETYRSQKAEIFDAMQLKMINEAVSPSKLKKATLSSVVHAFEAFHKAGRLENNQPTETINHQIFGKVSIDMARDMGLAIPSKCIDIESSVDGVVVSENLKTQTANEDSNQVVSEVGIDAPSTPTTEEAVDEEGYVDIEED